MFATHFNPVRVKCVFQPADNLLVIVDTDLKLYTWAYGDKEIKNRNIRVPWYDVSIRHLHGNAYSINYGALDMSVLAVTNVFEYWPYVHHRSIIVANPIRQVDAACMAYPYIVVFSRAGNSLTTFDVSTDAFGISAKTSHTLMYPGQINDTHSIVCSDNTDTVAICNHNCTIILVYDNTTGAHVQTILYRPDPRVGWRGVSDVTRNSMCVYAYAYDVAGTVTGHRVTYASNEHTTSPDHTHLVFPSGLSCTIRGRRLTMVRNTLMGIGMRAADGCPYMAVISTTNGKLALNAYKRRQSVYPYKSVASSVGYNLVDIPYDCRVNDVFDTTKDIVCSVDGRELYWHKAEPYAHHALTFALCMRRNRRGVPVEVLSDCIFNEFIRRNVNTP